MRRSAIVAALLVLLVACGDDRDPARPSADTDVGRCLEAATALARLEPPTNLRELQDNAALVAATARAAAVEDDLLAAALRDLDGAATDMLDAARDGEQALVTRASRRAADAYEAIDAAAQGMETAECGRRSWGSEVTAIPA